MGSGTNGFRFVRMLHTSEGATYAEQRGLKLITMHRCLNTQCSKFGLPANVEQRVGLADGALPDPGVNDPTIQK